MFTMLILITVTIISIVIYDRYFEEKLQLKNMFIKRFPNKQLRFVIALVLLTIVNGALLIKDLHWAGFQFVSLIIICYIVFDTK
ncbi:hypothetical protein DWB64_02755 [Fusibacter sp. A1]|nr:hypothetical protein DWB64_02755 [Fusibacter sp. A1]